MKKTLAIVLICILLFLIACTSSFLIIKNCNSNVEKNKNINSEDIKENVSKINEHIVKAGRFDTDWEWNSSIIAEFPNDSNYHIKMDVDVNLMYNVIQNKEVYKEYAKRISVLPDDVDFNTSFVILLTTEEFKRRTRTRFGNCRYNSK